MTFRIGKALVLAALIALCALPVSAQTTINSTTTTGAVTATQQIVPLTSVTNISAGQRNLTGDLVYFEDNSGEVAQVNAVDTGALTVTLRRGVMGTNVAPHLTGTPVFTGPAQRFGLVDGYGTCTATNELFLPRINIRSNRVFDCLGGQWVHTNAAFGFPVLGSTVASPAGVLTPTGTVFKVSGTNAITGITLPKGALPGFTLAIEPTGVFTWTTATNIVLAGTAVVGKVLYFVWDGAKWSPSYVA